jgi:hypothetical protein
MAVVAALPLLVLGAQARSIDGDAIGPPRPWWWPLHMSPWPTRITFIVVGFVVAWWLAGIADRRNDQLRKAKGRKAD